MSTSDCCNSLPSDGHPTEPELRCMSYSQSIMSMPPPLTTSMTLTDAFPQGHKLPMGSNFHCLSFYCLTSVHTMVILLITILDIFNNTLTHSLLSVLSLSITLYTGRLHGLVNKSNLKNDIMQTFETCRPY